MGVHGLTKHLKEHGLLPSFTEETGEVFCSLPETVVEPGSTLAIDGSGLAFRIYRLAYFEHYKFVMSQRKLYEDDFHLITHLLPIMLDLKKIKQVTDEMMRLLIYTHKVNVSIYLDGNKQPMKVKTKASRDERKMMEDNNLRRFFTKQILPLSFGTRSRLKRVKIPDAYTFMSEFPIPILLFAQVEHCIYTWAEQYKVGGFDDSNVFFRVTQCESEADQAVAMESALDTSNRTYVIGQDSDYTIFGFPSNDEMWVMGDLHVQYLPLDGLTVDEDSIRGYVVTRQMIAEAFDMHEDLIIEASILIGNDYTGFVRDKKLRKSINFYRDRTSDAKTLKLEDILDSLSELGDYSVHSNNPEHQVNIEFSRNLFSLKNIDIYLEDADGEHGDPFSDTEEIKIDNEDETNNYVRAFNESEAEFDNEIFCSNTQIMLPFKNITFEDINLLPFLEDTLQVMRSQSLSFHCVPTGLQWRHVQLAKLFQRSILRTLRNALKRETCAYDISPCEIFEHLCFYHTLMDRTRKMAGANSATKFAGETDVRGSSKHVRIDLPIDEHKNAILDSVKKNRVTIIQGETGSGKSSRVPVMLLEAPPPDSTSNKVKMFICQPRRIAAKSLTERVRQTEPHLKDLIGLRMGHGVREYETSETRAWFVTTGYLVRYLANNPDAFHDIDYLLIDEVHERSIDSDILCLLAKRLLYTHPKIRIVLMSATVAAELYQTYFSIVDPPIFVGVRCHPINEFFVEDIGKHLNFSSRECKILNEIRDKCNKSRCKVAPNSHDIQKLHFLAAQIAVEVGIARSSVLIFVPGMADIVAITDIFEEMVSSIHYKIIPIHSDIPFEDQMEAFASAVQNEVKIVIATNAAESSITLPDVDNVICLGLCKAITYNQRSHRQMLETTWISKANATQRAGRTGRIREGNVYRLYPREAFENHFAKFEQGEILRTPLDSVILNLKTIVCDERISDVLKECIEPPDTVNIENSFASLYNRKFTSTPNDDFEITSLGNLVVSLGIDLAIGALVGFGVRFGLLRETIEIAAILSFPKSPWLLPNALLQEPKVFNDIVSKTYVSKAKFDGGLLSETFSIMNLLYDFDHSKNRSSFCKNYSVSFPRINRLASTRDNLRLRVAKCLGKEVSNLCLTLPPRDMCPSKLNCLRIIKLWIFNDAILKIGRSSKTLNDDHYTVHLKGDEINNTHLEEIFEKDRHSVTLENQTRTSFNGSFEPVDIDGENNALVALEFEKRLLSYTLDKDCDIAVSKIDSSFSVYILDKHKESAIHLLDQSFKLQEMINCESNENVFFKYSSRSRSKHAKNKLKALKEGLRQFSSTTNINVFIIDIPKGIGGSFNISYEGSSSMQQMDLRKLFRTPHLKFQKNRSCRQTLTFPKKKEIDDSLSLNITQNLPEGARLLHAIVAGRYKNPVVRFQHTPSSDCEDKDDAYLQVSLGVKPSGNKWKWTETNEAAILDFDSIPATTSPQSHDMFAVCGNILELKGGCVRAEGVSILPGHSLFVPLAIRCLGIDTSGHLGESESRFTAADNFCDFFNEHMADQELQYFPLAVNLLCEAFGSLDGIIMEPWVDDVSDETPSGKKNQIVKNAVNKRQSSRTLKTDKQTSNEMKYQVDGQTGSYFNNATVEGHDQEVGDVSLGAMICRELGSNNVPSSFVDTFEEKEFIIENKKYGTNSSNKPEHEKQHLYDCPICDQSAVQLNLRQLMMHLCVTHFGFSLQTWNKKHRCNRCNKKFTKKNRFAIWDHYIQVHTELDFQPKLYQSELSQGVAAAAYNTSHCKKKTEVMKVESLEIQELISKKKKLYKCPQCDLHDQNPLTLHELEKHLCVAHLGFNLEEQDEESQCIECNRKLTKNGVWQHYIAVHSQFKFQPKKHLIK